MGEAFGPPRDGQLAQEVLAMLALRESVAVPHWAGNRLATLCGASGARVLRVFPIGAARRPGESGQFSAAEDADGDVSPAATGADHELEAAIAQRRVVRCATAGRLLIPLACGDEVRYVVELNGAAGRVGDLAEALMLLVGSYFDLVADAETDPLTRLANRRVFYSQVGRELARRDVGPRKRFLAVIDIDHFKQINDRFGHLYGDEILIHFARLMRSTFRAGDLLYRFGGEEFVILYGVAQHEDRRLALERFRGAVEAYQFPRVGQVTASIGFTALAGPIVPATTLVDRADNAVYYAKRSGRNRICEYEALVAEGALQAPQVEAGGEATLF
jgi:diguanylate cyclase (GGDEF)-like protein